MAQTMLSPSCAFGLLSSIRHGAYFVEEGMIVFPVGHSVAVHEIESTTQRFVPGLIESEEITAVSVSDQRRQLAIAEKGEDAMILVYDLQTLKRRKTIKTGELEIKEIVSLAFSPDGKFLAAQGGAPNWILTVWWWEKAKLVASIKVSSTPSQLIQQCLFVPPSGASICVMGPDTFKQFRLTESALKQQPHILSKQENVIFSCLQWIEERVVVGLADGTILCCQGSEVIWTKTLDSDDIVESIARSPTGFVAGTNTGKLLFFESDKSEIYVTGQVLTLHSTAITHMTVSPSRDQLLSTTSDGQMLMLSFASLEVRVDIRPVFTAFHHGVVHGLSTCLRKQLIATCGSDRSIRLWNYGTKSTEFVKHFAEECFSVALHPCATWIVAGFADKLRLMTILVEDFKIVKEFPIRACVECQFSTGGQYFAAAGGSTVFIYGTYTGETLTTLRAHSGKISSLFWSSDDSRLISAGLDGAVYEWDIKERKRSKENVLKGCSYASVVATADLNSILAVGSDMKLKEFEDIQDGTAQITKDVAAHTELTQLALPTNEKVLFAATKSGTIRIYTYPLNGEFTEYKCQSKTITRLALSVDNSVLAVVGHDGSVFVLNIRDDDFASKIRREQSLLPWADEVLVSKTELDEKQQRMVDLETKVNEITMQTEYQLRLKDLNLQEQLKEQSDAHEKDLQSEKKRFELLSQEKNEMELEYEDKLKTQKDRSLQQLNALDSQYQQKILNEVERYQQLLQEKDTLNKRWDEQNAMLAEAHETTIQELTEEYEQKLQNAHQSNEQLTSEKQLLEKEFEEIRTQLEEDADREVDDLKVRYEKKLMDEREIGLRLKGQNGIMRKKFNALQSDIDAQKEEIRSLFDQKQDLYQTITGLEKDILGLKKAVRERDDTISDKEKRIYDLKKKNQELEKFKFVLDYKIKELKSLIDPKDEEIEQYKEQVKEMDLELQQYQDASSASDVAIADLQLGRETMNRQLERERHAKGQAQREVDVLVGELEDVVQYVQHPKTLKQKIIAMHRRHQSHAVSAVLDNEHMEHESDRQRIYLEKTVASLKVKSAQEAKIHRLNTVRSMQENAELIKEINDLRKRLGQASPASDPQLKSSALQTQITAQTEQITQLKAELREKESRILYLERSVVSRPVSRERSPMT